MVEPRSRKEGYRIAGMKPKRTGVRTGQKKRSRPIFQSQRGYGKQQAKPRRSTGSEHVPDNRPSRRRNKYGQEYPLSMTVPKTHRKESRYSPPPKLVGGEKIPEKTYPLYRNGKCLGTCTVVQARRNPVGRANYTYTVALDGKVVCKAKLQVGVMHWLRSA